MYTELYKLDLCKSIMYVLYAWKAAWPESSRSHG